MRTLPSVLMGGVLPFGVVFVELFFILSSIYQHRFYYLFGFMAVVLVILLVTCMQISIVMTYFQLCSENYHWWWRAFFTSGASALYLFLYASYYFATRVHIVKVCTFVRTYVRACVRSWESACVCARWLLCVGVYM
jgi:transmembrane 9 superfamily protein 2/4